jgi:hypothetical protein
VTKSDVGCQNNPSLRRLVWNFQAFFWLREFLFSNLVHAPPAANPYRTLEI